MEQIPYYLNTSLENLPFEVWSDFAEIKGRYLISNFGRVKSLRHPSGFFREKILKQGDKQPYLMVSIKYSNGDFYPTGVHILVANTFVGNPDNLPLVHHKDHNKKNNIPSNLEYTTYIQNARYASEAGVHYGHKGEDNGGNKLSQEQVLEISKNSDPAWVIQKKYPFISKGTINDIRAGRRWSWLTGIKPAKRFNQLSPESIIEIFKTEGSIMKVAKMYGVSFLTVQEIRTRKRWKEVTSKIKI